eukprot:10282809-Alexandrium_andersonii.AAC.1
MGRSQKFKSWVGTAMALNNPASKIGSGANAPLDKAAVEASPKVPIGPLQGLDFDESWRTPNARADPEGAALHEVPPGL